MKQQLDELQRLMDLYSPAQVAVWLGLQDPRPIHQWIIRSKIPRTRLAKVTQLLTIKGSNNGKIIRRPKREKKETA